MTYECTEHTKGLMGTFLVDVSQDKPDIHPAHFCNNCYRACRQHEKLESEGKDYNCSIQVQQWDEHATVIHATNSPTVKREEGPRRRQKIVGDQNTQADSVTRAKIKYLWWPREPLRVAHRVRTPRVAHRASHTVTFIPRTASFTPRVAHSTFYTRVAHSTFYTVRRTQYVLHRAQLSFTPRRTQHVLHLAQ